MSYKLNSKELKYVNNLFKNIEARKGIGENLFLSISQLTPIINVDIILERKKDNSILLTWRSDDFYGPGWHVPGGIVRYKERLIDRLKYVARHELMLENLMFKGPIDFHQMFNFQRNIRGHFISFVFKSTLDGDPPVQIKAKDNKLIDGHWRWFKHCPDNFIKNQKSLKKYFKK